MRRIAWLLLVGVLSISLMPLAVSAGRRNNGGRIRVRKTTPKPRPTRNPEGRHVKSSKRNRPNGHLGKLISDIIETLLSPERYNSRIRPGLDSGKPLLVYVNIFVNEISSVSEVNMEYSMTVYLRQTWRDERLSFLDTNYNKSITLNYNLFSSIWTPDLFIRNLKKGLFHDITVPNRLIRLSPDGTILYSQRVSLTLSCDMHLDKYPMDNQTCKIDFGSYGYTTEELILKWKEVPHPVEVNPTISMPKFKLLRVHQRGCTKAFNTTGSYPCIVAFFEMERRLKSYLLHDYLPSLLVVILSWVSFWIDLDAVPARISLGILTILTISTQSSGVNRNMPSVSLTKAIDVWMATCLIFVFAAFIEYSIVNVLSRKHMQKKKIIAAKEAIVKQQAEQEAYALHNGKNSLPHKHHHARYRHPRDADEMGPEHQALCRDEYHNVPSSHKNAVDTLAELHISWFSKVRNNQALMVDVLSRVLFPLLFLLFNAIYWPMYFYSNW